MTELMNDLIGNWHTAVHAAIKAVALFVTATILESRGTVSFLPAPAEPPRS